MLLNESSLEPLFMLCLVFIIIIIFFFPWQESSKMPRCCLPKWNTSQILRRKSRKNFLDSCDTPLPQSLWHFEKICTEASWWLLHCCTWSVHKCGRTLNQSDSEFRLTSFISSVFWLYCSSRLVINEALAWLFPRRPQFGQIDKNSRLSSWFYYNLRRYSQIQWRIRWMN